VTVNCSFAFRWWLWRALLDAREQQMSRPTRHLAVRATFSRGLGVLMSFVIDDVDFCCASQPPPPPADAAAVTVTPDYVLYITARRLRGRSEERAVMSIKNAAVSIERLMWHSLAGV